MNRDIKYSVVLFIKNIRMKDLAAINSLLSNGIKVIVFTSPGVSNTLEGIELKKYSEKRYFNIYYVDTDNINIKTETIQMSDNKGLYDVCGVVAIDGNDISKVIILHKENEKYCEKYKTSNEFNIGQYKADHASESKKFIIVEAGAGAGKTTTMIDRVAFLTGRHNADLESIHMITFTVKSTKTMKKKIEKYFIEKFSTSTNKEKYRELLEKQGNMVIRTIDAYFKDLVSAIGVELGCNNNTSIKSYKYEKQNLIKRFLNGEFCKSQNEINDLNEGLKHLIKEIPLYDIEKKILKLWEKLNIEGLHDDDIVSLNWGDVDKTNTPEVNNLINKLFEKAMKVLPAKIQEMKKENNKIELIDFTIKLQQYLDFDNYNDTETKNKLNRIAQIMRNKNFNPKYILIDEFQDTNSDQINIIVAINKILENQIFIVGDKKQGIYRFRGAKHTAFDEARSFIKEEDREDIELKINYRTGRDVLEFIQQKEMGNWILGEKHKKFLDYELKPGSKIKEGRYEKLLVDNSSDVIRNSQDVIRRTNIIKKIEDIIIENQIKPNYKQVEEYKKAILENRKCDEFEGLDKEIINQIDYIIKKETENMINEETKSYVKNILSRYESDLTILVRYNWEARKIKQLCDEEKVICDLDIDGNFYNCRAVRDFKYLVGAFLFDEEKYKLSLKDTPYIGVSKIYSKYKEEFKNERFYVVINKIINESRVINNYYNEQFAILQEYKKTKSSKIEEEAKNRAKEYQMNLNKLINILKSNKSKDIGLKSVYDFLEIQIKTNRTENEEKVDRNSIIKCITVHKSKGQEYENLFIPFTDNIFINDNRSDILVKNNKVGFQLVYRNKTKTKRYYNNNYKIFVEKENNELIEDEMRLLYVALTRVEKNLIVIRLNKPRINTWGNLLSEDGIEKND